MTDVRLDQTNDGGEIYLDDLGNIELVQNLNTSVYISLLGGGGWWADASLTDSDRKLTGETGQLIEELPPSSSNLIAIEEAVKRDLAWMLNIGAATRIDAEASLANIDELTIRVTIEYDGQQQDLTYSLNWTT